MHVRTCEDATYLGADLIQGLLHVGGYVHSGVVAHSELEHLRNLGVLDEGAISPAPLPQQLIGFHWLLRPLSAVD